MKYAYYPGCSLEGTAVEYDRSTRAVMEILGVELVEIDDWTCCGASAAEATSRLLSLALPARNLALMEKDPELNEVLAPCSACYLNLKHVEKKIRKDPGLMSQINTVLEEEDLKLEGRARVRHLLDVLSTDIDPQAIDQRIVHRMDTLRVAPYYGCQCLRPYKEFDDPEAPVSMEPLIRATGAQVIDWSVGSRCCGASLLTTKKETGMVFVADILKAARGADCIVTVCPMCQMNLEAFQSEASRLANERLEISVLYLPQFIGMAMGLSCDTLRMEMNIAFTGAFQEKLATV
jgi:heterodisulfide reductase subunit B